MQRNIVRLIVLCALLSPAALLHATGGSLEVEYRAESGTLRVAAQDVPLEQVLAQIGRQARFRVLIDPAISRTVTVSFSERTLDVVMANLLRGLNTVTLYRDGSISGGSNNIAEIRILAQGKEPNGVLKSLVELEQEDRLTQRKMYRETTKEQRDKRKKEKEKDKLEARRQRLEALRESDPERYQKRMAQLEKRKDK